VALLLLAAICAFSPRISLESRARRLRLKSRVATIEESRKGIGIEGERSRVNGVGVGAGGVGGENGGGSIESREGKGRKVHAEESSMSQWWDLLSVRQAVPIDQKGSPRKSVDVSNIKARSSVAGSSAKLRKAAAPKEHDPLYNPEWYRGVGKETIADRDISHMQTKVLSRDDASRYRSFKGHLLLDNPEARELMTSRPKHTSERLRVRWPPNSKIGRPIHLSLHQRQFMEDGLPGTFRLHGKLGQAQLAYPALGKGGVVVLGMFGYDPLAVKRLPKEDVSWKFGKCAVVSNSGEVLRSKMGAEIDAHDAVFRINYPPTEKFEEYVGSKTTIELVNHHHARELAMSESYVTRRFLDPSRCTPSPLGKPVPSYCTHAVECLKGECYIEPRSQGPQSAAPIRQDKDRSTLVMVESMDSSGWRYSFLDAFFTRFPPPLATAISPDFLMAADEMWRTISTNVSDSAVSCRQVMRRAEALQSQPVGYHHLKHVGVRSFASRIGAEEGCKPSTGWFAILLALQVCDEVDAYGFSSWKKRTAHQAGASRYHYFDNVEGVDNVHSFDLTHRVLRKLEEHYPLRLRGPQ